jgi:hypothetical protein
MSQQLLSFENQEYDLNGFFNIQINFDQLKFLIISMTKSMKQANQRISDLEEINNIREKKIDELEKQTNNQDIFLSSKYKNFYSTKSFEQTDKDGKVEFY